MSYKKDTYDYVGKGFTKPITVEEIKESLIQTLKEDNNVTDEQINNPDVQTVINDKVNQIMFGLWEDINYMSENHENKIDEILDNIPDYEG